MGSPKNIRKQSTPGIGIPSKIFKCSKDGVMEKGLNVLIKQTEHAQGDDFILPDGMKIKERFIDLISGKFELKSLCPSDVSNLQPDVKNLNLRQCGKILKKNPAIG